LPDGWIVHEPPSFRAGPSLQDQQTALRATLGESDRPVTIAGHSMGAALAVMAACEQPERIERLLLMAAAGLPLSKQLRTRLAAFVRQVAARAYRPGEVVRTLRPALVAPQSALRLARAVRSLDLREQLAEVRRRGIRCDVVGCVTDTLTPVGHCHRVAELAGA